MKNKNITYYLLALFLVICEFNINAQSKRVLKWEANKAVANKDWSAASQYYNKLYRKDSSSVIKYKYAEVCRLNYELDMSIKLFLGIVKTDNDTRFPLSYYWLGQLFKNKEQYKEAKAWFTRFTKQNYVGEKSAYYTTKANLEIEACDWALEELKKKNKIQIEHLSQSINSKSNEFAAVEKDSVLYFSSAKFPDKRSDDEQEIIFNKVYRTEFKNKKWQKVRLLDTTFNKPNFHHANAAFNESNTMMVISRCFTVNATDYQCQLFLSKKENGKWQVPNAFNQNINPINTTNTQANFGILNNKTVLFFSSNRSGGEGGMDIWYTIINPDGSAESPINAGKEVNTVDDEITPWFQNNTKTLFFSSNYHKGLGGYDIFKSEFKENAFVNIQNLGYPINSCHNDIYYTINSNATKVYLSSNRVGSFFESKINCCNDIYRITIDTAKPITPKPIQTPPIKKDTVIVLKEQLKLLVPLTLYFNNDEPDPRTKYVSTNKNYENLFYNYSRLAQVYVNEYCKDLRGEQKTLASEDILTFFEDSLEAGMNNLRTFTEMLEKVLLKGETVKLTFKGYCSPLASSDYNINLAKRRISSLRNYFTEYKNGWFLKYINNPIEKEGKIIFEEVDIGELAESKASDDFKDKRNSVYSPKAACERKIQILAIQFGN